MIYNSINSHHPIIKQFPPKSRHCAAFLGSCLPFRNKLLVIFVNLSAQTRGGVSNQGPRVVNAMTFTPVKPCLTHLSWIRGIHVTFGRTRGANLVGELNKLTRQGPGSPV